MCSERCTRLERAACLLFAFCQHALLCGPLGMSTFLCLMLIHVTCSGTMGCQNWGRKRACFLGHDAFSGQLCCYLERVTNLLHEK